MIPEEHARQQIDTMLITSSLSIPGYKISILALFGHEYQLFAKADATANTLKNTGRKNCQSWRNLLN